MLQRVIIAAQTLKIDLLSYAIYGKVVFQIRVELNDTLRKTSVCYPLVPKHERFYVSFTLFIDARRLVDGFDFHSDVNAISLIVLNVQQIEDIYILLSVSSIRTYF